MPREGDWWHPKYIRDAVQTTARRRSAPKDRQPPSWCPLAIATLWPQQCEYEKVFSAGPPPSELRAGTEARHWFLLFSYPKPVFSPPPPPLPPLLLCSIFILFHSASSLLPRRLFPFEPSASSQSYRLRPLKCKVAIEEPIDLVYSLYTPISAESRQRELPDENTRGAWEENATAGLEGTLVAIFLAPDAMCFSLLLLMPRW